jgi:hypothetical protein
MDLYSRMTLEMKDNLIRFHQASPEIIRQVEERFQEYSRSTISPLMEQELFAQILRQIELKNLPIRGLFRTKVWYMSHQKLGSTRTKPNFFSASFHGARRDF